MFNRKSKYFSHKTIIIIGGSEGIGLGVAEEISRYSCNLVVVSRNRIKLERAVKYLELTSHSTTSISYFVADINDKESLAALKNQVLSQFGDIDIVINSAGVAISRYFLDYKSSELKALIDVNYFGPINIFQTFLPFFQEKQKGHIVQTASVLGFMGLFGFSAYAASKHALVGLCESLYSEYKNQNIRISVLCPPATHTPGFEVENLTKPKAVLAAERKIPPITVGLVAKTLTNAMPKNTFMIVPSFLARLVYMAHRFAPRAVRNMSLLNKADSVYE
ncbi:SDR family NAD(P)-dependent oxidoreductase [Teredinibacter waterburyi]|uniref:SDR family NAD(P)-dependent oxidoreductase n=1 Tax=Teredinibacter waterburyi TaxID=1500538 RepID=UPI00165F5BF3|nr:SDR family NAD(P)-dependent oxidoreductase [Teredinibacter waterburyi]